MPPDFVHLSVASEALSRAEHVANVDHSAIVSRDEHATAEIAARAARKLAEQSARLEFAERNAELNFERLKAEQDDRLRSAEQSAEMHIGRLAADNTAQLRAAFEKLEHAMFTNSNAAAIADRLAREKSELETALTQTHANPNLEDSRRQAGILMVTNMRMQNRLADLEERHRKELNDAVMLAQTDATGRVQAAVRTALADHIANAKPAATLVTAAATPVRSAKLTDGSLPVVHSLRSLPPVPLLPFGRAFATRTSSSTVTITKASTKADPPKAPRGGDPPDSDHDDDDDHPFRMPKPGKKGKGGGDDGDDGGDGGGGGGGDPDDDDDDDEGGDPDDPEDEEDDEAPGPSSGGKSNAKLILGVAKMLEKQEKVNSMKITVGSLPDPPQFQSWLMKLRAEVCQASGVGDKAFP